MKKIILYQDETLNLDLKNIAFNLNRVCNFLKFSSSKNKCELKTSILKSPDSYNTLSDLIKKETENIFHAFIFSEKQYYNNYFFESFGNQVIISFFGWDSLTKLSMHNGVVFFIADLLALHIDNSFRHDDTTGCIYDFGWNKAGIDIEMREAKLCQKCQRRISKKKLSIEKSKIYDDLKLILSELRKASNKDTDIVFHWRAVEKKPVSKREKQEKSKLFLEKYDVYLAHNSLDKIEVKFICEELKRRGLNPWLDTEQIPPGRISQDYIQLAINNISAVAIIIGENGLGKWQALELRSFITQCVNRNIPVIPVLLPSIAQLPDYLIFLGEFTWVNFIHDIKDSDAFDNLEWGITGIHPNQKKKKSN